MLPADKFPKPQAEITIRKFLYGLGQDLTINLPNHYPTWGFKSYAHTETKDSSSVEEVCVPVRLSRTASEGNPIRDFDSPFPAIDTATIWGWAKGNVFAERIVKDRVGGMYVRNPNSNAKLWRIRANQLRPFTDREYARVQTFPDDWVFHGNNKRDYQLQIGNAVPVVFVKNIALKVKQALEVADGKVNRIIEVGEQVCLF